MSEQKLFAIRLGAAPPHFVTTTYVGEAAGSVDGSKVTLKNLVRIFEVMSQTRDGFSVALNAGDELVLGKEATFELGPDTITAWVAPSTHPELFKVIEAYEKQKRAAKAGLVMPGGVQRQGPQAVRPS